MSPYSEAQDSIRMQMFLKVHLCGFFLTRGQIKFFKYVRFYVPSL